MFLFYSPLPFVYIGMVIVDLIYFYLLLNQHLSLVMDRILLGLANGLEVDFNVGIFILNMLALCYWD